MHSHQCNIWSHPFDQCPAHTITPPASATQLYGLPHGATWYGMILGLIRATYPGSIPPHHPPPLPPPWACAIKGSDSSLRSSSAHSATTKSGEMLMLFWWNKDSHTMCSKTSLWHKLKYCKWKQSRNAFKKCNLPPHKNVPFRIPEKW